MKILTITNQKGGLGKTAVGTNIARVMADSFNKKILFLDLDVQGNASDTLEKFKSKLCATDLMSRVLKEEEIKAVVEGSQSIVLCSADDNLANTENLDKGMCSANLANNLKALGEHFDYCIIDTPPTLGNILVIALLVTGQILIPVELDSFSLLGLNKLLTTYQNINMVRSQNGMATCDLLGIVINKFVSSRKRQQELLEQLQKSAIGSLLLNDKIHTSGAIQDALSNSCSLNELRAIKGHTDKRAINEFYALTLEILNHDTK